MALLRRERARALVGGVALAAADLEAAAGALPRLVAPLHLSSAAQTAFGHAANCIRARRRLRRRSRARERAPPRGGRGPLPRSDPGWRAGQTRHRLRAARARRRS